ncbi:MAG TPA: hypothetical protein VKH81_05505 [Candidatus Angelobacter sp.]|nr:hypothetical protein [Candidatus Angelobacter sp.]
MRAEGREDEFSASNAICLRYYSPIPFAWGPQVQKLLLPSVFCVIVVIIPRVVAFSAEDDLSGFTMRQLNAAINSGGMAKQKLYSILTFDSQERDGANIAVLSASGSGWHVAVLHRVAGGFTVEWRSGNLSDDFGVSSSSQLEIEDVGDEQVVKFSGCAAHLCGGLDGVFGILLYSPQSKQAFFAHYVHDTSKPIGSFGSLEFSKNANAPGNERYKAALQKAMKAELRL